MMMENGKYPTWRWIVGILLGALTLISAGWIGSVNEDLKAADKRINQIYQTLVRIETKVDQLGERVNSRK